MAAPILKGKDVFMLGPGFIGWPVLEYLVGEGYKVTALVRRREHGEALKKCGAEVVMGSLDDRDLIAEHAAKNDITMHIATADHLPSAQAVLDGVKKRAADGKMTIYIHTSGTSVLDDGSLGDYKNEKIYYDDKREDIDALPNDAPHRQIDLAIVKAQKELGDRAKIAIMIPPLIYGYNASNERLTIQIPTITRLALKHGYAGQVGKGLAVESQIHVNDLARAYMVLLHHIEKSPSYELLQNPYFFCENGSEFSWREVAENIGKNLHKAGKIKDPEPQTFHQEAWSDLFDKYTGAVMGLNSRSRAVRLRKLGWNPREKSLWDSYVEDELPAILAENNENFSGYKGTVASGKD